MSTHIPLTPTKDLLIQHGLTGDRLIRLARRAANDAQRKAPAGLGGKYEDLVSFLLMQALEAVARFEPDKIRPGYTFSSYLYDIMEQRVTDFYRRKSEGFGDRRNGSDNRIVFAGDIIEDELDTGSLSAEEQIDFEKTKRRLSEDEWLKEEDRKYELWADAAGSAATPMIDWAHVDERRMMKWVRAAAKRKGMTFEDFVRRALDSYADELLDEAA